MAHYTGPLFKGTNSMLKSASYAILRNVDVDCMISKGECTHRENKKVNNAKRAMAEGDSSSDNDMDEVDELSMP